MTTALPLTERGAILVLVDGANLRGALENHLGGARLDARGFAAYANSFGRAQIHWFQGAYSTTQGFFSHLRGAGIQVHSRRPKTLPDGRRKADMDVDLSLWGASEAHAFGTVLLVSGDGDFLPLVHRLQADGKRVISLAVPEMRAWEYRDVIQPADLLDLRQEIFHFQLGVWN